VKDQVSHPYGTRDGKTKYSELNCRKHSSDLISS